MKKCHKEWINLKQQPENKFIKTVRMGIIIRKLVIILFLLVKKTLKIQIGIVLNMDNINN